MTLRSARLSLVLLTGLWTIACAPICEEAVQCERASPSNQYVVRAATFQCAIKLPISVVSIRQIHEAPNLWGNDRIVSGENLGEVRLSWVDTKALQVWLPEIEEAEAKNVLTDPRKTWRDVRVTILVGPSKVAVRD